MGLEVVFFDSYAFFEVIRGNPNYINKTKDIVIITTKLNLMELYYGILVFKGSKEADICYDKFIEFVVEIDNETIKEAMKFRAINKGKGLSYVDCIGYITALKHNAKFLTGDEQFRDMKNVQFIK